MPDVRRSVPRTDHVLADPGLASVVQRLGRDRVKAAIHCAQQRVRDGEIAPSAVVQDVVVELSRARSLRPVINATGVLVHTNLGRAPLSVAARKAVADAAGNTDVEFDLVSGQRAPRGQGALDALAAAVPAAEAVHVVNNAAAALLLCATEFASQGGEIVLSRGEMVEIGDGFRIPELLTSTGATIREVGMTNRVALDDYRAALSDRTAFILKIHPSNFAVSGFISEVSVTDLVSLDRRLVVDAGSGLLTRSGELPDEPDVTSALRAGADVVLCSGDKLLGGPQAGLLFGGLADINRLRRNPAARALRVDKLTLAALEATLLGGPTPVSQALTVPVEVLANRADSLVARLGVAGVSVLTIKCLATVGGGGAPGVSLSSVALSLPAGFAARLRTGDPAVVGRLERDRCLLDLRSVADADDDLLCGAIVAAADSSAETSPDFA